MTTLAKIEKIKITEDKLVSILTDGREVATPLSWYEPLQKLNKSELSKYKLICGGTGAEWEDIDYQLSLEGMMLGINPSKKPKAVRLNISIREDALAMIDNYTKAHHLSRSAFLEDAALQVISRAS
jgi:Protein of unknown function (DUF2442)